MTTTNEQPRGKRRFSYVLSTFLATLTGLGLFYDPLAWDMAKFYAPMLLPIITALWLGDGWLANQRVLGASGNSR